MDSNEVISDDGCYFLSDGLAKLTKLENLTL